MEILLEKVEINTKKGSLRPKRRNYLLEEGKLTRKKGNSLGKSLN